MNSEQLRQRQRLAAVIAHEWYGNGKSVLGHDLEITNFDDEYDFVDAVDGGYWVEARVWIPAEDVEGRVS